MSFFFRTVPDGLGGNFNRPQPEVIKPDKDQCLECAFGKLLANGGIQTAEQEQVVGVITEAQSVSSSRLHARATIYRCGALGCEHAMMAITGVDQPVLPENPSDISLSPLPGSTDCVIPKEDLA